MTEELKDFQELAELGQRNFALKEELDRLLAANKEIPKLKQELADLEQEKTELKQRHEGEMKELKKQLEDAKKKVSEDAENQTKMLAAKLTEMSHQLADVMKKTKEKDEEVKQLKSQVKTHKTDVRVKMEQLEKLQRKAGQFMPFISFLRNSRSIPMYIEDLSVRIMNLKKQQKEEDEKLAKLDQDVTDLHRHNDDLARKIKAKAAEIAENKAKLKGTKGKIKDTKAEIEKTNVSLGQAQEKLEAAKEAGAQLASEVEGKMKTIRDERAKVDAIVKEKQALRDEAQRELDGMKSETDRELESYSTKIQDLRAKLNSIKETGDDGDGTRVDKELQQQIGRVIEEKGQLNDQIMMLKQAIELVEEEIRQKGLKIQQITLKMEPTEKILAHPDFQEKQLFLEELILQNRELRNTFSEMTERAEQLRTENSNLRKQINAKTKQ